MRAGDYERDSESGLLVPRRRGVLHARPQWMCGPGFFGGATDPYFSSVSALLHMDGANGSTAISDQKSNIWTAAGSAAISTSQSKFGGASLFLGGTNSSYASTPNSSAFDLASADFTIETWVYLVATGSAGGALVGRWGTGPSTNTDFIFAIVGGKLVFQVTYSGGVSLNDTTAFSTATWVHVAVTRSGNVWTMWRNGAAVATQTLALGVPYSPAQTVRLGVWNDTASYLNGYLDDLRITKGVARYTAGFTPPTAAFPNS